MTTERPTFEASSAELRAALQAFLHRHRPETGIPVWLAVSGGIDSTALLLTAVDPALRPRLPRLGVVHVDHGQFDGSAATAAWVERLARSHRLPCRVLRPELGPGSSEADLRSARMACFDAVGPGQIWTAHHADDQLETLAFRLQRGTGRRGLAGIPELRPLGAATVVGRPLLNSRRQHLAARVAAAGITPRRDPSNQDLRFARNRIRHQTLPELRAAHPDPDRAERRWLRFAARTGTVFARREAAARHWLAENGRRRSPRRIDLASDPGSVPAPVWTEVGRLLHHACLGTAPTGAWSTRFEALRAAATGTRLAAAAGLWIERRAAHVECALGAAPATSPTRLPPGVRVWWGDGFGLLARGGTLTCRAPRPGDTLATARGCRPRPLRDLLRSARVPLLDRDGWPVVVDSDDRPLWTPNPGDADRWRFRLPSGAGAVEVVRPSGSVDLPPTAYWCSQRADAGALLPPTGGHSHPMARPDDERSQAASRGFGHPPQSAWIT